jgi:hypothetical protein
MTLLEFDDIAAANTYRPKGIFYSEMFLFVQACLEARVTLVVESGIGISTSLLSAVDRWPVIAVDRSETAVAGSSPAGVQFVHGDAQTLVPHLIATCGHTRIGVLIDGPKGMQALALKDACLMYQAVKVVALHSPTRGYGETSHSHDPEWAANRVLDRFIPDEFRERYPNGPGLTLWERA